MNISRNARGLYRLTAYLAAVVLWPLLGAWLVGKPLAPYLEFPPKPVYAQPVRFSWPVFILLAILTAACLLPFISKLIRTDSRLPEPETAKRYYPDRSFPAWGWIGLAAMALSWLLAWSRFEWFAHLQEFTFTPLWLSYIVVVNALVYWRTGHCPLLARSRYYLLLFGLSALVWWSFEYLNLFVRNWYYVGVADLGESAYFLFATLPFSTVLPAVLGTAELLAVWPAADAGLDRFRPFSLPDPKLVSAVLLSAAGLGLIAVAAWPGEVFFLVWILPLLLILGLQSLTEKPALFRDIKAGDWRRPWTLAMAGLICGLFWEMWNHESLAHWKYALPYIQRFQIFEMPVLGYAGYLPFGIFCGLIADAVLSSPGALRDNKKDVRGAPVHFEH